MTRNRNEQLKAKRVATALGCNYTRGLRIVREAGDWIKDWAVVTDEELRSLYDDIK